MGIKNVSKVGATEYKHMMRSLMKLPNTKICVGFALASGAFAVVLMALYVFDMCDVWIAVIPTVCCVVFVWLIYLSKKLLAVPDKFARGVEYSYNFFENEFTVETELEGQRSISTFEYDSLYDVKDRGSFMLIYISKEEVLFLRYEGFNLEDRDRCRQKLLEYSKKNRNK